MIDHEMRKAVYLLSTSGVNISQISSQLHIARSTIRMIIEKKGEMPTTVRSDRITVDPDHLKDLYTKCDGYKQRIHEMLKAEGVEIAYSTLTQHIRELDLGKTQERCDQVDDKPGEEMQQDTSPYQKEIGGTPTKITASLLYFRYSKQRYLKFYRSFTRFQMKCFFHEALTFYAYAASRCIIDNTNLAVAHGTGKHAVMHLEMARFLERYGSEFIAHEIKHSNRKAGNERSFWTVETNFFPGRTFASLEDLNHQAFIWATENMAARPQTKKIIPNEFFEMEKPYLKKVAPHLPPPYFVHTDRSTDQYGYTAFCANYYWIPGTGRHDVKILEYADKIKIFRGRHEMAEYQLPPSGTKGKRIKPDGVQVEDRFARNQKRPTQNEEHELRALGGEVPNYLDFIRQKAGLKRHIVIRDLHRLGQRGDPDAFKEAIARALRYRVTDLGIIERMFIFYLNAKNLEPISPEIDHGYTERECFRDGEQSEKPDLSSYNNL